METGKKKQLLVDISERDKYLRDLNAQIEFAEKAGADSIQAIKDEIETLDYKKAALLHKCFSIEQRIRDAESKLLLINA